MRPPDPERVTRRRPRGEAIPDSLKIVPVKRRATKAELAEFRQLWVNKEHTRVVATTQDEKFAQSFGHSRSYLRDSKTNLWEYEVVFGPASVSNALQVLKRV